jgi:hypothetical protein
LCISFFLCNPFSPAIFSFLHALSFSCDNVNQQRKYPESRVSVLYREYPKLVCDM